MATTTVTTTRTSQLTLSGTDTLSIGANGNFTASTNPAVVVNATTGAGITIDNSGILASTNTGGRAIRFTNANTSFHLTNEAGASITSQNDAINVQQALTAGTLLVDNHGSITSTGVNSNNGQAIDFSAITATGVSITINNHAGALLQSADSDGIRPGNGGVVNNWGTINGQNYQTNSGADGIDFQTSLGGTVHNYAGGQISGGRHGINHSQVSSNTTASITLINDQGATVEGRNGSGFGSDNAGEVTNYGLIVGRADSIAGVANGDGDGVDIDYIGTIHNWGTIQGAGAKGVGSDGKANTSQGVALGGGTIENHAGAKIISTGDGVLVDNSSEGDAFAATHITNEGLIKGDAAYGIHLISSWADSLSNSGTIEGGNGIAVDMGGGNDTVTLSGGSITGLVDGGAGNDRLDLSAETHGLTVDLGAGTVSGTAWVSSIAHFEMVLTGSGQDTLTGGTGDDVLDGGLGADRLVGGAGNDIYVVDNAGDLVVEATGGGLDTVRASISYELRAAVEDLVLTGSATLRGAGNALDNHLTANDAGNQLAGYDGNDTLLGGAGNDSLNGGAGADSMAGGAGNDIYVVDDAGDVVVEQAGQGTDQVQASIDYTLGANVENLVLTGSADISGTGNALANLIRGNAGANLLRGGGGADTINGYGGDDTLVGGGAGDLLTGGAGSDLFRFDAPGEGPDHIMDFTPGLDHIGLTAAGFGITGTLLLSQDVASGGAAQLVYRQATGALSWDADGDGAGAAVLLAWVMGKPALAAADVVLL